MKSTKKTKTVAVFFSGGLDSTYLIWKNLKEGNTVFPIYVEIENNKIKTKLEKNRTKLLYEKFREEFSFNICDIEYSLRVKVTGGSSNLYFQQMPIWILALLYNQNCYSEIQIGYVMNDDAMSYLKDIEKIYRSYEAISEKLIPITFPLKKVSKHQMARDLPRKYLNLIISCENPKILGKETDEFIEYEPCCECVPCRHIIADKYYYTNSFPENYRKKLIAKKADSLLEDGYKIIDTEGNEVKLSNSFENELWVKKWKAVGHQLKIEFPLSDEDKLSGDVEIEYVKELSLEENLALAKEKILTGY